jgi:hypothetical protein
MLSFFLHLKEWEDASHVGSWKIIRTDYVGVVFAKNFLDGSHLKKFG